MSSGKEVAISGIRSYNVEATKVYNFEVADNHTYFVGEDGVLVHNYLAGGPGIWPINSEWGNSVMEFLGLREPTTQLAAKAATDPEGTAKDVAKELAAPPCNEGEVCAVFPGIGLANKVAGKAVNKVLGKELAKEGAEKGVKEGVYDLGTKKLHGTTLEKYVGQSKDIMKRVDTHFKNGGKLSDQELKNAIFHSMPKSTKKEREVYEHYLITEKYGIKNLQNQRKPMGGREKEYRELRDQVIQKYELPK